MDSTSALEPQTLLGQRYRIEKIVGQGGMGAVYEAADSSLGGKRVAVKEMRLSANDDKTQQQALAQFRLEAQFLANLEHPNLVQVYDFFAEGGRQYLVMDLVKGQSLGEMLQSRKGAFPLARVLEWGRQLATVLTYLHNQDPPILFRDLKPSNIMLDNTGTLRLIDFGIARSFSPEGATATFLQGMGSAGYSPLEQYQGAGGTDPRSDIYAMGATLFHLLTNQVPPSPVELLSENKPMPTVRRWNPTLPPEIDRIILKMMGIRKEERYQKMEQVQGLLDQLARAIEPTAEDGTQALGGASYLPAPDSSALANAPTMAVSHGKPTATMPGERESRTMWMSVAVLTLVLLAVAGWIGGQGGPSGVERDSKRTELARSTPAPAVEPELPEQSPISLPVASRPVQQAPVQAASTRVPPRPTARIATPSVAPLPTVSRPVSAISPPKPIVPSLGDAPRVPTARVQIHKKAVPPSPVPDMGPRPAAEFPPVGSRGAPPPPGQPQDSPPGGQPRRAGRFPGPQHRPFPPGPPMGPPPYGPPPDGPGRGYGPPPEPSKGIPGY